MLHVPLVRNLFSRRIAPQGIYEYTIARTKYIDAVFSEALAEGYDQILIFGAGFDTRALRFQGEAGDTRVFELDVPVTQEAKLRQYARRGLDIPKNLRFIPIDFDKESLPDRLEEAGFTSGARSLFLLEGLLMYLQPESVHETFRVIGRFAGEGSEVVFDYVRASVLRKEGLHYGEAAVSERVASAGEGWHFGIEEEELVQFLTQFGLTVREHLAPHDLARLYFTDASGEIVGRVNGTHCLVRAASAPSIDLRAETRS
jgi:methyltransferase (TIGR00027 family)